ncbi:MAG: DUF3299 domain-containing protein [Pseudomonadota bacterium]
MTLQQLGTRLSVALVTWIGVGLACFAAESDFSSDSEFPPAVDVSTVAPIAIRLAPLEELGYYDADDIYVRDVLEGEHVFLAVRVETADGQPIHNAKPKIAITGASRELEGIEFALPGASDEYGIFEFVVLPGPMGRDEVELVLGDSRTVLRLNIISLRAAGFPMPPVVEGGIPWNALLEAKIEYRDQYLEAKFPEALTAKAGQQVKLSGFMMPLDPDLTQKRFLLTASPPSCFFHVPGGPAGAVEVLAPKGIEATWNPIVLEGRFEPMTRSEIGIVYRLLDARQLKQ